MHHNKFDFNMILKLITEMLGTRHYMTFMLFLGMANAYVMRTNMSVAIVAMVSDYFEINCFKMAIINVLSCL